MASGKEARKTKQAEGVASAAPPSQKLMIKASSVKEIPEGELVKHKVRDIIGFVKAGNISMVHGLINYHGIG